MFVTLCAVREAAPSVLVCEGSGQRSCSVQTAAAAHALLHASLPAFLLPLSFLDGAANVELCMDCVSFGSVKVGIAKNY